MKNVLAILMTLALLGATATIHADEIGPATPIHNQSASVTALDETGGGLPTSTSASAGDETGGGAGETGTLEYFLSLFE